MLAFLLLGLLDGDRAWTSFDRDAMARLHATSPITDPVGKAKSVAFTAEGKTRAEGLLGALFAAPGQA